MRRRATFEPGDVADAGALTPPPPVRADSRRRRRAGRRLHAAAAAAAESPFDEFPPTPGADRRSAATARCRSAATPSPFGQGSFERSGAAAADTPPFGGLPPAPALHFGAGAAARAGAGCRGRAATWSPPTATT